jgi:hypothetical protein
MPGVWEAKFGRWVLYAQRVQICLEFLWGHDLVFGRRELTRLPAMAEFAPHRICQIHHFDICPGRCGHWIARDRDGLIGGTFLSRHDAVRFALFETGGDPSYVHEARTLRHRGHR